MKPEEKVLCWNCSGAKNQEFLREMREMMRHHKPSLLILLEPKISGTMATEVCKKLKNTQWIHSEVEGFSGSIWVLWDENDIQVRPRYVHQQFVHVSSFD